MSREIKPGLLILHGNRLELLRDAVFEWLGRHPLQPLEEEVFLVQSNGVAEWLKMALASASGVCAAARVELPARFLWRSYRQLLGRAEVPARSALDKDALGWRLMRLLPQRLAEPGFEPIAGFLAGGDIDRRLQLSMRLADLYDQYQVYRADWLGAWEAGRDVLIGADGAKQPLPADQRWQPALWRDLLAELNPAEQEATRPRLHARFLAALAAGAAPEQPLPRRIVLFGASQLPGQSLQALAGLAGRAQVLLAIPNPCRFHWADIIDGRELLQSQRRRQPARGSRDLAALPLESMHLHAHPLLAAWGRLGRDFMRQLDAFDDAESARRRFDLPRIDLFDDDGGRALLGQVQAAIRDLLPLAEHPPRLVAASDRSIVFHTAHSAQREVEVLHDQLLGLLADPPGGAPLTPRDIVVMVPDIEVFAPAVRAVFGQLPRSDARHIPFEIADLAHRGSNRLVMALEWLLGIPLQRFRLAEVSDLLDVPAIAGRFGLTEGDLPRMAAWLAGAGVRWGLHAEHREQLGLGACGEQNSWAFGLRRMLLGYAAGDGDAFAGIEPYDEIGGLEAALVGPLVELIDRLADWWTLAQSVATPTEWAARGRALLDAVAAPTDEPERLTLAALQAALAGWLEACDAGHFDEPVPLSVLREGWLGGIDAPAGGRRFFAGGVTFCTLMPLRAVPFEVVCLLGMNDGDYPRQAHRSDFDLMGLAGQQRPGDRSRRHDDRYLMLEALLSARRVLSISWVGHSARDNSPQPPSVLVSQLRDYLAAGWQSASGDVLAERTSQHPLQPFSRRYFEGGALTTFAREWRAAHRPASTTAAPAMPAFDTDGGGLTVARLASFLKNPVREFFRLRLGVAYREDETVGDDEPFHVDRLDEWSLLDELLADPQSLLAGDPEVALARRLARIAGSGRLPMAEMGRRAAAELTGAVLPMLAAWSEVRQRHPHAAPRQPLHFSAHGLRLDDGLDGLHSDGLTQLRVGLAASRLTDDKGRPRAEKLIDAWLMTLACSACGQAAGGVLIDRQATLVLPPLDSDVAAALIGDVLLAWREGMQSPLPLAPATALAWLGGGESAAIEAYEGGYNRRGEVADPCWARVYPDFESLAADGRFADLAERLFAPLRGWVQGIRVTPHPVVASTAGTETVHG